MILRYARHTTDLQKIETFYTEIIGLDKIGEFKNHNHYNGIFLGHKNSNWHLEFTTSLDIPNHKFDEDDALVFYVYTNLELEKIKETLLNHNINLLRPKNPYWVENGIMIEDPDGFKVIFSVKHLSFTSNDALTTLVKDASIQHWSDLVEHIRTLPYGRNLNREDFSLVLKENKGTCSSKHAFLKKIADLNHFESVQLIIGMYKMNHVNTPKIGNTLLDSGLSYVPEAHCYLKLNGKRIDITTLHSNIEHLRESILEEIEIKPEQVNTFKVEYHQKYLKEWIKKENIPLRFEELWRVREHCIKKLGE